MVFTVPNVNKNQDNASQKSVDLQNELSSALGKLVQTLSDAYFSDKGKEINIVARFVVPTTGTVSYIIFVFIFNFDYFSKDWDSYVTGTFAVYIPLVLLLIGGYSIYLGVLVSLTKFQYSYIRLFLAGVLLPAIVFALIPRLS